LIVSRHLGKQSQRPDEEQHARDIWDSLQQQLGNPLVALGMMVARAQDNLRRYKEKQPFVGHLLPYLTAEEARREQLNFQEDVGWLETPNIKA
jgi:hypothetical protein